jgi:hypothetical protein
MSSLTRASGASAVVFAVAQIIDMRLTGRPASKTPVRVVERVMRRPIEGEFARITTGYGAQSSVPVAAAVFASLVDGSRTRRFGAALAGSVGGGVLVDSGLGASDSPWRWSRQDWARELVLKSALAATVAVTL